MKRFMDSHQLWCDDTTISLRGLRGCQHHQGSSGAITLEFTSTSPPSLLPLILIQRKGCLMVIISRIQNQCQIILYLYPILFRMGSFMGICCSLNLCADFLRVTQIFSLFWKEIHSNIEYKIVCCYQKPYCIISFWVDYFLNISRTTKLSRAQRW